MNETLHVNRSSSSPHQQAGCRLVCLLSGPQMNVFTLQVTRCTDKGEFD